ncbi:peptidylprolyl isomerase [Noviherbaspirillum denitrificans]|uniref:peptidylprolyl isomerase n=1 Tax=Noviherbaspirillum denitrificans TaxID=1968433 RepID=A0A254TBB9_9BURK|nr:peptidylprolyl isomerase [Noviherbaspirillum denitrificans]OWW19950.1 peptidylprolyl isomerase [Noviherbaspirillum denitrificans]
MGISVNGIEITDDAIQKEIVHHQKAENPLKKTVHELVLHTLLLQEADRLGMDGDDEEARIEALLAQEVRVPEADDAACETYYRNHQQRYTYGELVEARHILFQVTPDVSLEFLRATAESVLEELQVNPDRFAELARTYSNCPSGALGGNLGQLARGQTVSEFERVLFRLKEGEIANRLVETRFGLHIVQVMKHVEGKLLPYDSVKTQIAETLTQQSWHRALHQYLQILVGKADIQGVTLEGAGSPLVQ